ncbi:MAG: T9SS type A sorting domain-containing protein [Crocinitomicaceae bacterium]|nr:T9SS type A sorting domain-containing protein [Crocinitomicaceae bacterium]
MKKILLLCAILTAFAGISQELQAAGDKISVQPYSPNYVSNPQNKSTSCGNDTLLYLETKMTGANPISINNASSAHAFCQFFDCPSPVTIHGVRFIAYKPDNSNGNSIDVQAYVYKAKVDSLPLGGFLTTGETAVDTILYGFNLDALTKTIMFDSAVTVTEDYVIVVMNNSATPITMYSSDYDNNDGQGEHLGSARIGFNWVRGYGLNVGGSPFNADMLFYPIVTYDLDADFIHTPNCELLSSTDSLNNTSSGILFNRFYSQAALNGEDSIQCVWDYGDGSPLDTTINSVHNYPAGVFNTMLTTTIMGWTNTCTDTDTLSTCYQPAKITDYSQVELNIYPNPSQNYINIVSSNAIEAIALVDMGGKIILNQSVSSLLEAQIDVSHLPNGVYSARIQLDNGHYLHRRIQILK